MLSQNHPIEHARALKKYSKSSNHDVEFSFHANKKALKPFVQASREFMFQENAFLFSSGFYCAYLRLRSGSLLYWGIVRDLNRNPCMLQYLNGEAFREDELHFLYSLGLFSSYLLSLSFLLRRVYPLFYGEPYRLNRMHRNLLVLLFRILPFFNKYIIYIIVNLLMFLFFSALVFFFFFFKLNLLLFEIMRFKFFFFF